MIRRLRLLVFVAGSTGLVALTVWPYHDWVLRYGLPVSLAAVWSTALWAWWQWKFLRTILLALPVLLAIPFLLPGKPMDPVKLHTRYTAELRRMEGVAYVWGGESRSGIDCSGLPRRALRNVLLETGWKTGNGTAFREWSRQWWFDTSAAALGQNYRGFTRPLGVAGKLRDLTTANLSAGDFAVTGDGRHLMVYLEDDTWIQADPMVLKVTIGKENAWFSSYVTMHRWVLLE